MDMLIQELKRRWVAFPEVVEYTGLDHNRALRHIDNLSFKLPIAEMKYDKWVWYKIMNEEDYTRRNA